MNVVKFIKIFKIEELNNTRLLSRKIDIYNEYKGEYKEYKGD